MGLKEGQPVKAEGILGPRIGDTKHLVYFGRDQAIIPNEFLTNPMDDGSVNPNPTPQFRVQE